MKIVEVIPVVKGITRPTLSYFTKESFLPGQFVKVPVRSGSTVGIVSSISDARQSKSSLKEAPFALKKLSKIERAGSLSKSFMLAAEATAKFYGTTVGSTLSALLPKKFLESPELIGKAFESRIDTPREVRLVQLTFDERFREYRGIVRENFARKKSVMFIVPTEDEVKRSVALLSLGIEKFVYTSKHFDEARADRHPVLFITTPSHVVFNRLDLDTIILERENSRAYRAMSRPYINLKKFLEYYSRVRGLSLIFGDSVLSLETLWHERESEYAEFSPLSWRLKFPSSSEIINMREEKSFEVFSPKLKDAITESLSQGKKVFLFALRKGLSATTVCGDCGTVLLCKNCNSPMVLHNGPIYVCHHCSARRSPETRCDNCGSWKLTPLGIGIDRVVEEARQAFPEAEVLVLDKDRVKTKSQAKAVIKKFEESPKTILVGTELALYYLDHAPLVAAVTLDSLFSIPDFGMSERVFYLITRLRETAGEKLILQTRNAGEGVLEFAATGNVLDFYRSEIAEREETMYPPFSIFIKVTTSGSQDAVERKAAYLQSLFGEYEPHFSLGRELNMVFRLPRSSWPRADVVEKLLLLTPDFLIKVDPESIL